MALLRAAFPVIGVIIVWIAWGSISFMLPGSVRDYPSDRMGVWGDSFGPLSSLFTAFGFLAVFAGFRLQRRQEEENRKEQHRQRFELSFFRLVDLLRESRDSVSFRHSVAYAKARSLKTDNPAVNGFASSIRRASTMSRPETKGVDAFKAAWIEIRHHMRERLILNSSKSGIVSIYDRYVHGANESTFGPYFRILYTIASRIYEDEVLTNKEKIMYGNLLRSQLTSYEAALAGVNGMSKVSKDFSELVSEFRLLKYVPQGTRRKILVGHYPPKAFLPRD